MTVRDLANVFAAFRWGGLLRQHCTSAMDFPYSVAGLTDHTQCAGRTSTSRMRPTSRAAGSASRSGPSRSSSVSTTRRSCSGPPEGRGGSRGSVADVPARHADDRQARAAEPAWYGAGYAGSGLPAGAGTDTSGPARRRLAGPHGPAAALAGAAGTWRRATRPGRTVEDPRPRRRRIPRLVTWSAVVLVIGLIFRRAIASVVLMALSAALHLVGLNVHLPSVKFAWPWQTITAGTTTNTDLGPWVLQKIEGISKPALGQANFNFYFTHKVSKNIGPWPCWYESTFYAVGHAAATVDLNPGAVLVEAIGRSLPATGAQPSGARQSRPRGGEHGAAQPAAAAVGARRDDRQHPFAADRHAAQLDLSGPRLRPGAAAAVRQSVLYSQAQYIAFYKATHRTRSPARWCGPRRIRRC